MELFKVASTLFLGLGIAGVLQGQLLPDEEDFVISRRGRRFWSIVDVYLSTVMLVVIVAGELLVVRVLTAAPGPRRAALIHHSSGEVRVLLYVTAAYVVLRVLGQRALGSAWMLEGTTAKLDRRGSLEFFGALVCGAVAGSAVLYGVAADNPQVLKTGGGLWVLTLAIPAAFAAGGLAVIWISRSPRA